MWPLPTVGLNEVLGEFTPAKMFHNPGGHDCILGGTIPQFCGHVGKVQLQMVVFGAAGVGKGLRCWSNLLRQSQKT